MQIDESENKDAKALWVMGASANQVH